MSDDLQHAFAHPEARAAASAAPGRDRISLRDHTVSVEIGAFQQERGTTQRLRFNIVVEVQLPESLADDVDRILSYDVLTDAITAALAEERLNLLETLAERVAERILADPRAARVFLRVEKLDRGPGALGVEIERRATPHLRAALPAAATSAVAPTVVFLPDAAIRGAMLPDLLDRLHAAPAPVVLCVDLPSEPRPIVPQSEARQRIDLLALEQNAWLLAARDARCSVVATRTELDWALKQGHLTIWAPAKMVLDATEPPTMTAEGLAPRLALWLANHLPAGRLLYLETTPPPGGGDLPMCRCTAEDLIRRLS